MGDWKLLRKNKRTCLSKDDLISESFSLWLKPQKLVPNHSSEHLLFKRLWIRGVSWQLVFGDLSQCEKDSEIMSALLETQEYSPKYDLRKTESRSRNLTLPKSEMPKCSGLTSHKWMGWSKTFSSSSSKSKMARGHPYNT